MSKEKSNSSLNSLKIENFIKDRKISISLRKTYSHHIFNKSKS